MNDVLLVATVVVKGMNFFRVIFGLGHEWSRERTVPGTKVPGNEWSRERMFQGTNGPENESSIMGTNGPGTE